jgi:carboxymethylenebutenolidase
MGGRLSSVSTTLGLGLAGAIPFYGWPTGESRNGTPAPADVAGNIESDLLIFYGEKDEGITKDVRDAFDRALDKAGVKHETVVYPGAPHGFFDRHFDEFGEASKDAWDRTLAFIRRHTMGQPIAAAAPAASEGGKQHEHHLSDPRAEIWADQVKGEDS